MSCTFFDESQVVKLVRAIRMGLIKRDKPKEEQQFYHLWGDDSSSIEKANHLSFIPAPKSKLPGISLSHLLDFIILHYIIYVKKLEQQL